MTHLRKEAAAMDNSHQTQMQILFDYLQNHLATASMVTAATGVPQKCITRYKRELEKAGRLWQITKKTCKETGFKAYYLTTDKSKAPQCSNQLSLF